MKKGNGANGAAIQIERVTFGDVFVCSGQSNMDLSSEYTFSAPEITKRAIAGQLDNIRLFMMGDMGTKYVQTEPAWVTTEGSIGSPVDAGGKWGNMTVATSNRSSGSSTLFSSFSATCLYFAVSLSDQLGAKVCCKARLASDRSLYERKGNWCLQKRKFE